MPLAEPDNLDWQKKLRRSSGLARFDYLLRTLACLFVLLVHVSLFYGEAGSWFWVYALAHTLVYPHVVFFFSRSRLDGMRNIVIDSFLYGVCVAVWGFNPFLTLAMVTGLTMTNLVAGGVRLQIMSMLAFSTGCIVSISLNEAYFRPDVNLSSVIIMSVGLFLYTCVFSSFSYDITGKLLRIKKDLSRQREHLLAINSMTQAVNSFLEIDMIMRQVSRVIRKNYAFDHIYLFTLDSDGKTVCKVNGYGRGLNSRDLQIFSTVQCKIDEHPGSIFLSPLLTKKPGYVRKMGACNKELLDSFDQKINQIRPCISVAVFPLKVRQKAIGNIALVSVKKPVDLTEKTLEFISTLLFHVGTAVYNARLYEKSRIASAEARKAQARAEESEEAKGRFLANMSHEIRTPMTAIIGYSEALLEDDIPRDEKIRFINTIIRCGNHLLSVINDILDLSKIDAKKLETEKIPVNLPQLIDDLCSTIGLKAQEKGLGFDVLTDFPLPRVFYSDPTRLKQIMFNLANNSVKFTANGKVGLRILYDSEKNSMVFEISDTGIGLTAEQRQLLFRPFSQADSSTTRQYGGTGLGLYISLQLANLLGGTIRVKSKYGEGSTFSVSVDPGDLGDADWLNCQADWQGAMQECIKVAADFTVPQLRGTVLVAEDNTDNQLLARHLLEKCGLECTLVASGRQAVDEFERKPFGLVLLDIQMPVMGGEAAAIEIRKLDDSVPLLAFTANVMEHQLESYIRAGFNGFISKPVNQADFYRTISQFLPARERKLSGKVLLAEDNVVNSKLIIRHINKIDDSIELIHVENGKDALNEALNKHFDLILMDMEMPVMSGDEAVIRLRKQGINTPVWMCTGNTDLTFQRRFKEIGAQGYLAKPFDKVKLAEVLDHCLKSAADNSRDRSL